MSIHWSITRAADWVIRLQEDNKTDLDKEELISLFTEWVEQSKKDKPKKSPEETKAARVKGASNARETKRSKDETLSDEEKYEKKVFSQKKRAAKAKVGSDAWNKMTEDEKETLIQEDHRKDSQKEKTDKENPSKNEPEEPTEEHDEEPTEDDQETDEEPTEEADEKEPVEEPDEKEPVEEEPVPSKLPAADKKKKTSKSDGKEKKKKSKKEKSTEDSDGELDFE